MKNMKKRLFKSAIQTIPAIIIGGILAALAQYIHNDFLEKLSVLSFSLVPSLLGGFIAKEECGSVGFIPGAIVGYLGHEMGLGILGGIAAGVSIVFFVNIMKKIKISLEVSSVMYMVGIPVFSTIAGGLFLNYVVQEPILFLIENLNNFLNGFDAENNIFLNFILGGLIGVDLGGPVNKMAYLYAITTLEYGRGDIMGPVAVAISVPPLAMGTAQFLLKNRFSRVEREAGIMTLFLGVIGITEGALVYLTKDIKILPAAVFGGAVGAGAASILKVASKIPHGGLIVLPLVENKIGFLVAVAIGVISANFILFFLKSPIKHE